MKNQSLWKRSGQRDLTVLLIRLALACLLLFTLLCSRMVYAQMPAEIQIGELEFYGYGGLDLGKIKAGLPVQVGDRIPEDKMAETLRRTGAAIKSITGKAPTDLAPVCCDPHGHWFLYVGLPGTFSHQFRYSAVPTGKAKLPANISALYQHLMDAIMKAVQTGHAAEDDSQGYSLTADPAARSLEMTLWHYALSHTNDICHVLASSASAQQRQVSAMALGYAVQSPMQIHALVQASRDSDEVVRNNATRALMVLAGARPQAARQIPVAPFIAMLNSGIWTDRNKGSFLLSALSADRNPQILHQLQTDAMPALIEMAHWDIGHAGAALIILGRIGGLPDSKTESMIQAGQVEEIVTAAQGTPAALATTPAPAASPSTSIHLTITGTQTTLGDALQTLSHQTGTMILIESAVASKSVSPADLSQPSVEAILTHLTSAVPGVTWEKISLPQEQPLPTADSLADTMRALEGISVTQVTAQNPASQISLLFSKTTAASGTATVTTSGMQTVYLVRAASSAPATPASPITQSVRNLKAIADLFAQMTPDQQRQAIPQMMPEIMRLMQNMDPNVRAGLLSQFGSGN